MHHLTSLKWPHGEGDVNRMKSGVEGQLALMSVNKSKRVMRICSERRGEHRLYLFLRCGPDDSAGSSGGWRMALQPVTLPDNLGRTSGLTKVPDPISPPMRFKSAWNSCCRSSVEVKWTSQPIHWCFCAKGGHKSVLWHILESMRVKPRPGLCMKEQKSDWAQQGDDVFHLVWISVIFGPAGASHKASHGAKADSHWHWWTRQQIHFLSITQRPGALIPPSPPLKPSYT